MQPVRIVNDAQEVDVRLAEFGTSKAELTGVALAAAGAKADAVEDDPITAPGTLSYIFGTRALRRTFRAKGWELDRSGGIESVYNAERGIKIVFQNADSAADLARDPRSISDKGNATARAVSLAQLDLFVEVHEEEIKKDTAPIWYLFVHISEDDVRAELSRPRTIEEKQFQGFYERIFIINEDSPEGVSYEMDDVESSQDFDVNVTRK